jgi:hypothetical protein
MMMENTATVANTGFIETPFDPTGMRPDFSYWAEMPYWTRSEAAILTLGWDPLIFSGVTIADPATTPWFHSLERMRLRIERADFPPSTDRDRVQPIDYLHWAHRSGIEVPRELADAVSVKVAVSPKAERANSEAELSETAKRSVLKMVAGMAVNAYGFNPRAPRNTATKQIADDVRKLGLSIDEDTVRKWLSESAELVAEEGFPRT